LVHNFIITDQYEFPCKGCKIHPELTPKNWDVLLFEENGPLYEAFSKEYARCKDIAYMMEGYRLSYM